MASKCKICKKFISPADGIKCIKCMALFHPVCLRLSPGHRVSSKWCCNTCKVGKTDDKVLPKSPSNHSLLELHDQDIDKQITSHLVETSPSGLAEEVRQVIRAEMSCLREELARICATIADFSMRADAIETRLTALEERFSASQIQEQSRLTALEERVSACGKQEGNESVNEIITQLQNQLNDREQEYFLNDVEISGLQERNGENLVHLTSLIGKKLGIELGERDVVSVERVGPRHGVTEGESQPRPRLVSVRLARRALRDDLLRAARVRRGADTSGIIDGSPRRFYINERLTRANKQLFYKAREEGRRKGWRYVWSSGGRIFIRHDANATAHRVRSDNDLKKFFMGTVC